MSSPLNLPSSFHPVQGSPGKYIYQPFFAPQEPPSSEPSSVDVRFNELDEEFWEHWAVADEGLVSLTDPMRCPISIEPQRLNEILRGAAMVEEGRWQEISIKGSICGVMDRSSKDGEKCLIVYQSSLSQSQSSGLKIGREMIGQNPGKIHMVRCMQENLQLQPSNQVISQALLEAGLLERLNLGGKCTAIASPPSRTLINPGNPALGNRGILVFEESAIAVLSERGNPKSWKAYNWTSIFRDIASAAVHLCQANYFLLCLSPDQFFVKDDGGVCLFQLLGGRTLDTPTLPVSLMRNDPLGRFAQGTIPLSDFHELTELLSCQTLSPQEIRARYVAILAKTNAFVFGTTILRLFFQHRYFSFIGRTLGSDSGLKFCPESYRESSFVSQLHGEWQSALANLGAPTRFISFLEGLLSFDWKTRTSLEEALQQIEKMR